MAIKVKTGGIVPESGQYKPVGGNNEYTFVEGNKVPPNKTGNQEYVLVDRTKHKKK